MGLVYCGVFEEHIMAQFIKMFLLFMLVSFNNYNGVFMDNYNENKVSLFYNLYLVDD